MLTQTPTLTHVSRTFVPPALRKFAKFVQAPFDDSYRAYAENDEYKAAYSLNQFRRQSAGTIEGTVAEVGMKIHDRVKSGGVRPDIASSVIASVHNAAKAGLPGGLGLALAYAGGDALKTTLDHIASHHSYDFESAKKVGETFNDALIESGSTVAEAARSLACGMPNDHSKTLVYASAMQLAADSSITSKEQAISTLAYNVLETGPNNLCYFEVDAIGKTALSRLADKNPSARQALVDFDVRQTRAYEESKTEPVHLDYSPAYNRLHSDDYNAFRQTLKSIMEKKA